MASHRHLIVARRHPFLLALPVSMLYLPGVAAQSETATSSPQTYQQELERQGRLIEQLQQQLDSLKQTLQKNNSQNSQKNTSPTTKSSAAQAKPTSSVAKNSPSPVGQKPPEPEANTRALPENVSSGNGVLIGKGNALWEASLSYSYTDNNRVFLDGYSFIPALVVGLIDIRQVKRHSFIGSVSTRYGLTDRWEFEIKVPYVYRDDTQRSRPVSIGVSEDEVFNANGEGLGDIQVSTRYQLNDAGQGVIYVANLSATFPTGKSPFEVEFVESTPGAVFPTELPTGSGYTSIQPSLSAIYPTDPGVFFGNLSYSYNDKTDDEETGEVDAGDGIGVSFGLGVSLNARTSMSLSYSHKHVLKSEINDEKIEGSELDIGQLIVGYSFRYSSQSSINTSLAVGVTDDAQDVRLNIRFQSPF